MFTTSALPALRPRRSLSCKSPTSPYLAPSPLPHPPHAFCSQQSNRVNLDNNVFSFFKKIYIYLVERQSYREERQILICWFTPRMTQWVELGQSESRTLVSHMDAGPHGPITSTAFPAYKQETGLEVEVGLEPRPIWDSRASEGSFIHSLQHSEDPLGCLLRTKVNFVSSGCTIHSGSFQTPATCLLLFSPLPLPLLSL